MSAPNPIDYEEIQDDVTLNNTSCDGHPCICDKYVPARGRLAAAVPGLLAEIERLKQALEARDGQ